MIPYYPQHQMPYPPPMVQPHYPPPDYYHQQHNYPIDVPCRPVRFTQRKSRKKDRGINALAVVCGWFILGIFPGGLFGPAATVGCWAVALFYACCVLGSRKS